jgi:acyl dehydratase
MRDGDGYTLATLDQFVGQELGVSSWLEVTQQRIQAFADCTGDHQWIHVDVERARRESAAGTTIAHGYLTLSLVSVLAREVGLVPAGVREAYNYGLDRVRFMSPVKSGARIRNRVVLIGVERRDDGRILVRTRNTIEIEGEAKPAMVSEKLAMLLPA